MTLSDISIKNPVFAWMLMLGLILFGAISLMSVGISLMPDVDFPVVTVHVTYKGAAPEIMDTDVVDIIEESVMSIQGVRTISSSSKQESASISIEFELSRDIDLALQEVQTKIAQVQQRLPIDMDPPLVMKSNPEDQPVLWMGLSSQGNERDLMIYARDHVKDRLQTVTGVGEIILSGYVTPTLRVWIDPQKLSAYELTVQDVMMAISKQHIETPAGRIETSTTEYNLRYLGEAMTPEEFGNILIAERGGQLINQPIRIKDVANVVLGLDDLRRMTRAQGKLAIGLGIKKQRGFNAVKVAEDILKRVEELKKTMPQGYEIGVNFDATVFIKNSIHEMQFELILSALLTAAVCLLFLASFGSTFNILLAIPTSIMGAFLFIKFLGFTLNNFSLLALTLAIGIVVDDAIMVLENIVRHQEMGKTPLQAASDGAREITSAAVATTLAIIAIFVPVIFMKGIVGKFFFQFGVVITITVALSLLEAITLTPMRCSRLTLVHHGNSRWAEKTDAAFQRLSTIYSKALGACLRHRYIVLVAALLLFVGSLAVVPKLKTEFVPSQDQSMMLMTAQAPIGSSIELTSLKMKEIEKIIATEPEVNRYITIIGGFAGGEVNKGMMFITLKQPKDRPVNPEAKKVLKQNEVMDVLRKKLSVVDKMRVTFQDLSTGGFSAQRDYPVSFSIRGPDWEKLTALSDQIVAEMKKNPAFVDVDSDFRFGQPEIDIIPKRDAIAAHGVKIEDVGTVINAMIGGVRYGRFTEGGHRNDIRLRVEKGYREDADAIKQLFVRNVHGELVSLSDLVEIKNKDTLQSITRQDRERSVSIFSNVATGATQQNAINAAQKIAEKNLPPGYRQVLSGSAETFKESFQSLFIALILGIIVAYMVLASQYNSYIHPVTVLLALPFSLTGAFVALWLFDQSLNLYSFIGLILLMGIAKKNSILLVDFTNQRRKEGMELFEAILTASPQRLRPILMTSFTIIAAAIPTALSLGSGSEVRVPMSAVIIGGMLVSTFLTLFVVPCAYSVFAKFEKGHVNP